MSNDILFDLLNDATKDKPVCRFEYQLRTGKPERKFRLDVEKMRKSAIRVVSNNGRGGYWIAKSTEEYLAFRGPYVARIKSMIDTVKAMDRNLFGQEEMEDVLLHGL